MRNYDIDEDEMCWIKRKIEDEFGDPIKDLDHITADRTISIRGGFLCMDAARAHIAYIYLEEESRGEGLCRYLIDAARDEFAAEHCLTLHCKPALVLLYEHLGFVVDESAPALLSRSITMVDEEAVCAQEGEA